VSDVCACVCVSDVCVCVCVCVCVSDVCVCVNLWVGKIPTGGNGNPLQDSCLGNPMDRGAWRATVHEVAKSWT